MDANVRNIKITEKEVMRYRDKIARMRRIKITMYAFGMSVGIIAIIGACTLNNIGNRQALPVSQYFLLFYGALVFGLSLIVPIIVFLRDWRKNKDKSPHTRKHVYLNLIEIIPLYGISNPIAIVRHDVLAEMCKIDPNVLRANLINYGKHKFQTYVYWGNGEYRIYRENFDLAPFVNSSFVGITTKNVDILLTNPKFDYLLPNKQIVQDIKQALQDKTNELKNQKLKTNQLTNSKY